MKPRWRVCFKHILLVYFMEMPPRLSLVSSTCDNREFSEPKDQEGFTRMICYTAKWYLVSTNQLKMFQMLSPSHQNPRFETSVTRGPGRKVVELGKLQPNCSDNDERFQLAVAAFIDNLTKYRPTKKSLLRIVKIRRLNLVHLEEIINTKQRPWTVFKLYEVWKTDFQFFYFPR